MHMGGSQALRLSEVFALALAGLTLDTLTFACVEQSAGSYVANG